MALPDCGTAPIVIATALVTAIHDNLRSSLSFLNISSILCAGSWPVSSKWFICVDTFIWTYRVYSITHLLCWKKKYYQIFKNWCHQAYAGGEWTFPYSCTRLNTKLMPQYGLCNTWKLYMSMTGHKAPCRIMVPNHKTISCPCIL